MALLSDKRITLAYTSGPIFPVIVHKLADSMCSIQVYNRPEPALDLTKAIADLQLSNKDLKLKSTTQWNEVLEFKPDIILFLNLNVLPHISDDDFFSAIYSEMTKIKIDFDLSMVMFGQNYRGLLAAAALIKASKCYHENVGDRVKVISSVHYAGRKMYTDDNSSVVLAMPGGNLFISYDGGQEDEGGKEDQDADVHKKLEVLGGVWKNNEFLMLESDAIVEAMLKYLQDGCLENIGLIGRLPSDNEKNEHEMAEGTTWMPNNGNEILLMKDTVKKNIRRLSSKVEEICDQHSIHPV